jgi:ribonuclease HI
MRVFTDGACIYNGRANAKAGYAAWFPEHPDFQKAERVPADQPQTNQRAELMAIHAAITLLDARGYHDEDIVIYTDSEYAMNCLTKWLPGWVGRGWKTTDGKDVLHQDLIRETSSLLAKFKGHRFVHVRAHTGGTDDLSKNNDIVDRLARGTLDDTVHIVHTPIGDELFSGCPLRALGPPVPQAEVIGWVRANLDKLDRDVVDKHLIKMFTEVCKTREITLTKQSISRTPMFRAERAHLQIERLGIDNTE